MKKRILLTGDDGYNSIGIRLLIDALRDKYDLQVVATLNQQSGVGGYISMKTGFDWEQAEVDGVPAIWVDGSPADAIELAREYFSKPFDLVISGINWGANLGSSIAGSGTVNAAIRALGNRLTNQAIAMSWDISIEFYTKNHDGLENLEQFRKYPGLAVNQVLDTVLHNNLWGAQLININFPLCQSNELTVTMFELDIQKIYEYLDQKITGQSGHYNYKGNRIRESSGKAIVTDLQAVNSGKISLTPCKFNWLDSSVYRKIAKKKFKL